MSDWRDRLIWAEENNQQRKKASFRGIPFFIRDSGRSVGRRNVVHQYPLKDIPYIEDLGQDIDEFTINGYVVQNKDNQQDYIDERDLLIEALRKFGPGTLIHPYYGELQVNLLGKARIEESFSQGGIARFTMTFVLVKEGKGIWGNFEGESWGIENAPYPKTVSDHAAFVDDVAEASINRAKDSFFEMFNSLALPSYTENSIMSSIGELNKMLRLVSRSVQAAFPSQVSQALAYLAKAYLGIDLSMISNACNLADGIIDMFNGLRSIGGLYGEVLSDRLLGACSSAVYGYYSGPMSSSKYISDIEIATGFENSTIEIPVKISEKFGQTAIRASLAMNRFGEDGNITPLSQYGGVIEPITISTYETARQSANLVAIINFVRVNAITVAIRTAVRVNYDSYDSAIEMTEEIVGELDALLLSLGNDSADTDYDPYNVTISSPGFYQAVQTLRPAFVEAMFSIGASLVRITEFEVPSATLSSLVLAYDKYLDLDREAEIIARNIPLISHPGFLPGGKIIEILNS